jgi:hypothetical protein
LASGCPFLTQTRHARWLSVFDLDQGVANLGSAFTWA